MPYIIVFLMAVSLSMDAFSLSLAYGTLNFKKRNIKDLSMIVGLFHFFMPLLGLLIGEIILKIIPINPNIVVTTVLSIIGFQMLIKKEENEQLEIMNICAMIFFAFAVSIDSFSVGIGLRAIYKSPIICSLTFMAVSYISTYMGLNLGKKVNQIIGKRAAKLGGIMLILLAVFFYIK